MGDENRDEIFSVSLNNIYIVASGRLRLEFAYLVFPDSSNIPLKPMSPIIRRQIL